MDDRPELFEEVKLYKNPRERDSYDNQANLFAIITTLEQLEKAYIRDGITPSDSLLHEIERYTPNCLNLLTQFKTAFKLVEKDFKTVEDFARKYKLDCPIALVRIKEDRPITVKDDKGNSAKCIAQTVSLFITLMDKLRLGIKANDELQPDLRELIDVMNRLSTLPPNFEGKAKIKKWYTQLQSMSASDEIDETQSRNMLLDLETAHYEFNQAI